jgi:hypothetical protein
MDAAERALLADTIGAAIDGERDADGMLVDIGWFDMLAAEPDDGLAIVFEALGRTNARSSAIDDVVTHALGIGPRADLAVVLPPFGTAVFDRSSGLATARAAVAPELLVIGGGDVAIVPAAAATVEVIDGIDPDAGLHSVRIDAAGVSTTIEHTRAIDYAVARAQRAIAHQTAGATRTMLTLAREHALERVQFGRPVARFQAVRHRLAEALVAVEALDAALVAAADTDNPEATRLAQLAKIVAGRTARTVASHCQQVLAGIGFTTDHPFHRYLKRTMLLDGLFGSADRLTREVGRDLVATAHVPTLIEL